MMPHFTIFLLCLPNINIAPTLLPALFTLGFTLWLSAPSRISVQLRGRAIIFMYSIFFSRKHSTGHVWAFDRHKSFFLWKWLQRSRFKFYILRFLCKMCPHCRPLHLHMISWKICIIHRMYIREYGITTSELFSCTCAPVHECVYARSFEVAPWEHAQHCY